MTRFLLTKTTWPVIRSVKFTLRAIYTTATLLWASLITILSILRTTLGLSVEAGLLNSTVIGLTVKVCVTVICRRRLLDSLVGHPVVRIASLMWLRQVTVPRPVLSLP